MIAPAIGYAARMIDPHELTSPRDSADRLDFPVHRSQLAVAVERLAGETRLDPLVGVVHRAARRFAPDTWGDLLSGDWLGHALHPMLTDLPLGCWTSAAMLDVVGGRAARPAARRLVGFGVLASVPAALTGAHDFRSIHHAPNRRVAAVHGVGNLAVVLCYSASWRSRRKGHPWRGVGLALLGGGLSVGTGYLGGHLVLASDDLAAATDGMGDPESGDRVPVVVHEAPRIVERRVG